MGLYIRHRSSYEHDTGGHPESAARIEAIERLLSDSGWMDMELVDAPRASTEQLLRVHTERHLDGIESLSAGGGGMIDMDTVMSAGSHVAALHAAGGAVLAVDQLLAGGERFAFCGLRPPGHHAESGRAMGFCLFNNAAVAAAHAIDARGAERVLVIDWDVHHGNGTNEIFERSRSVLYASIHQSPLYPGTGSIEETGSGEGEGYSLNLPVPPYSGPKDFLSLLQSVILPIARQFEPRLVIVSAGFDAHRDDPLAQCLLDEAAYSGMAASIRAFAEELAIPVMVCLEGGYDLEALASSVAATISAFTGKGAAPDAPREPAEPYRRRLSRYWDL